MRVVIALFSAALFLPAAPVVGQSFRNRRKRDRNKDVYERRPATSRRWPSHGSPKRPGQPRQCDRQRSSEHRRPRRGRRCGGGRGVAPGARGGRGGRRPARAADHRDRVGPRQHRPKSTRRVSARPHERGGAKARGAHRREGARRGDLAGGLRLRLLPLARSLLSDPLEQQPLVAVQLHLSWLPRQLEVP